MYIVSSKLLTSLLVVVSEQKTNCELMRDMGLVTKLLNILRDIHLSLPTIQTIASVICELLTGAPDPHGILRCVFVFYIFYFYFKIV